ncbi:hypothetical protein SH528x_001781 [Novipirellula sp. SH528]|uniref:hypothetical protein n=1 Tax=Novipirellula sp. SH528 TaxID=3454466 RepID=UPI003F9F99B4
MSEFPPHILPQSTPDSVNDSMATDTSSRRKRRWIRFGLLELLLLTAVVAAWLPVIFARPQIPVLESEIETMRFATSQLIIHDEQKLNARSLPSIWNNISSWKYSVAPDADLELRLATEFINEVGFPADYQSVALPEGEHSIHLKCTKDAEGHHSEVFIDDELVLQRHHPDAWLKSQGSSSTGEVSHQSAAYALNEPLKLKVQRFSIDHPLKKYESVDIPDEYDSKGNYLWISSATDVPRPSPAFHTPPNRHGQEGTGHRQGIKVFRSNQTELIGLLGVIPSLNSTLGDNRQYNPYCPLGISVQPILIDEPSPEILDQQINTIVRVPISLRDSIVEPNEYDDSYARELISENAIGSDGKTMRIFAHFKPFASRAKPIIEIIFDASHPDRVGFLPHAAPGSPSMTACQFVTRFDARFLWREVEMVPDAENAEDRSGKPLRKPLAALYSKYPKIDRAKLSDGTGAEIEPFAWQPISAARLPRASMPESELEMARLSLTTNVADATKLTYPAGLNQKWQYEGVANRQVWWLPTGNTEDEAKISVEIRAGWVYPNTRLPIPGGPVIQNVRITVPMPAKNPVWLEVVAEPEAE